MRTAQQEVDELLFDLDYEERERTAAGVCACGCGTQISTKRGKRYSDARHRNRRHQYRVRRAAELLGVRERQSLRTLREPDPTAERRADAPARRNRAQRRPRAGVSLYLPTLEHGARLLELLEASIATPPAAEHRGELPVIRDALARALERRRARDLSAQTQRPQEGHANP